MSEQTIDMSIENAASSVEMEGFVIDEQSKLLCKKLIKNEITFSDYIALVKEKYLKIT